MNFACLYAPDFLVQAITRIEEELQHQPVGILKAATPCVEVIAVNTKALQLGLYPGMTKVQAELFDIKLRPRVPSQEVAAHQALLDCAQAFSPRVENTGLDTVILDITGLEKLYRTPEDIGEALKRLAKEFGLVLNIGIAANPEAAKLAAHGCPGITSIPSGRELEHFGPLPVSILNLSPELHETFQSWGIYTLQALAALPEIGLIERLGQEGKRLQILARGMDQRPLVVMDPELTFEESIELESPIEFLEPLTFILARLLRPLCTRLMARSMAASALIFQLEMEPQIDEIPLSKEIIRTPGNFKYRSKLQLPVPVCDSKILLKLLQLHLEAHSPSAPITKVWLSAEAARPRKVQRELFVPRGPEPDLMEITLARINAVVGEGRVGSPVLCNTHRPDTFQIKTFRSAPEMKSHGASTNETDLPGIIVSALRRFRPVVPARVEMESSKLTFVTFHNQRHKVLAQSGPWRNSGDWWNELSWARDEWDITLAEKPSCKSKTFPFETVSNPASPVYRIYFDLHTQQWFVEGMYD